MPRPPSNLTPEQKKARNNSYQKKFREAHKHELPELRKRYAENSKRKTLE